MPGRIIFENLQIEDSKHPADYQGPAIFANFNPDWNVDSYPEKFPYVKTKEVILRNVTIASKKNLRLSENPFMFREVMIKAE